MPPKWPQFPKPTRLGDGRSWTAVFDSFDQRNDDAYYYVLVVEEGRDPNGFFARVSIPPEGEGSSGSALKALLREEIHRIAESGRTNTDYTGSLIGWQAAEWLKARRKQPRAPEEKLPGDPAGRPPRGRFFTSANGRLSYEMEDEPSQAIFPLLAFLEERFGWTSNFPIFGLDAIYCEGDVRGTKIVLGYDNWSGCFLQAFDGAGDLLVRAMGEALEAGKDREERISSGPVAAAATAAISSPSREAPAGPIPGLSRPPRAEPKTEAEFDKAVRALAGLAASVDSSNSCRLPSEEAGFEETPLETDLRELILQAVLPAIKKHPAWLTSERLEPLLRTCPALQPAVRAYRARLLSEMGDYGNEFSPLAAPSRLLIEGLAKALKARPSLRTRLEGFTPDLLDAGLTLFFTGPDGRIESDDRTIRERLADRESSALS